ncbi:beta strand repeat-containing protein, partial [Caviibacterium pharyngocola]
TDRLVGTDDLVLSVNTDNLASATNISYKANGGEAKAVSLATGFNFTNGTTTVASVNDNGVVSFDLNQATKDNIQKGVDAKSAVDKGIKFGNGTTNNTYALGDELAVEGDSNIVSTTTAKGVSLSLAKNITVDSVNAGGTILNSSGLTAGNVKVSSTGIDAGNTKITNVTAGSEDNDAVNFSQLNATNQNVSNNTANITKNAGNIANNTANITKNATEIAKGIKFGNGTKANQYQLGDTLNVTSGNANIISETIDGGVKLTLADSINLSSVTAGGTVLNSSGLTAGNVRVSSTGIDAGNTKISNVTAGTSDNDAVNLSQLNTSVAAAKTEVKAGTNIAGVTESKGDKGQTVYTVHANASTVTNASSEVKVTPTTKDNNVTEYAVDLSDAAKANITKGVEAKSAVDKGIKFGNGTKANQYQLGDTLNVTSGNANIVSETIDGGVKLTLADSINLSSVTAGGTVLNSSGLTAGNVKVSSGGIDAGNTKITNVTAGTSDNDAVNFSQLNATNQNVSNNTANITKNAGNIANNTANITKNAAEIAKGIKFGNGTTNNTYALGDELAVEGDSNIVSNTTAKGVSLSLAKNITVDSVNA